MIRTANTRKEGFYKIKVKGFAHQSDQPLTFSVGAVTFKRGAPNPVFGYYSFPPADPINYTRGADRLYRSQLHDQCGTYGISDPDLSRRRKEKIS